VIDNRDIWRVAKLMVKSHSECAEIIAAQHVDERLAQGDGIGRISGGRSSLRSKSFSG